MKENSLGPAKALLLGCPIALFLGGFLKDGKASGRPVGVTIDPRGVLIVADDLSDTIWRITRDRSATATAPAPAPPAA